MVGTTSRTVRPSIDDTLISVHPDELGLFAGSVYVVPFHKNKAKHKRTKDLVRAVRSSIASFRRGESIQTLQAATELRISQAGTLSILEVKFDLYRTGEIRILADPNISSDLCDQVYYLIKDMAHRHYHHSQSDDNLLPLSVAEAADDQSWRRNTLWCLARMVLEARRRDRLDGYKSALGMLAYAEAFQGLLGKVYRTGVGPSHFGFVTDTPNYDFAHTRCSLEAKIAEHEYRLSARAQSFALWISTILATAALWISAVQISAPVCEALKLNGETCETRLPHFTAHIAKFLIERPYEAYGVLLITALVYLGRRGLALVPLAIYDYAVVAWTQALGASASRATGANDRLGQIVVIVSALCIGGSLFGMVGLFTGVLHLPAVVLKLLGTLVGN